jgi:hypothetical protein
MSFELEAALPVTLLVGENGKNKNIFSSLRRPKWVFKCTNRESDHLRALFTHNIKPNRIKRAAIVFSPEMVFGMVRAQRGARFAKETHVCDFQVRATAARRVCFCFFLRCAEVSGKIANTRVRARDALLSPANCESTRKMFAFSIRAIRAAGEVFLLKHLCRCW